MTTMESWGNRRPNKIRYRGQKKRRAKTQCLKRRIVDLGQFCHFYQPNFFLFQFDTSATAVILTTSANKVCHIMILFSQLTVLYCTVSLCFDSFLSCQVIPTGRQRLLHLNCVTGKIYRFTWRNSEVGEQVSWNIWILVLFFIFHTAKWIDQVKRCCRTFGFFSSHTI